MSRQPQSLTDSLGSAALITGGAGFIGSNVAHALLSAGRRVILFDNLSRPGVEQNWLWLHGRFEDSVRLINADVRDADAVRDAVAQASQVFHFAAQVAVTTSLADPCEDFEVNARGTLNVLEAIRARKERPSLLFTSTNKVYGELNDVPLRVNGDRYEPQDSALRQRGIGESRPLDFHSPYGCSKGAADQYVIDYARTFDIPAVVFRMSCIYGPRQFGTEDQGWVAHFLIQALKGNPVTLYGDGMQVRDILFVEDLVRAMLLAQENVRRLSGRAFNIGGGPDNTISLLNLLELIEKLHGEKPECSFEEWRPGDQRYYVSDTAEFQRATGWSPRVDVYRGLERLYSWLREQRETPQARKSRRERSLAVPGVKS
jgi:CDP-paratose 2-epimerase